VEDQGGAYLTEGKAGRDERHEHNQIT